MGVQQERITTAQQETMESSERILEVAKLVAKVAGAFSPGAPIDEYALFAGRHSQVREIMEAITRRGQHIIIFGERGVGKTSLANILSEVLGHAELKSIEAGRINCDSTDNFSMIWRKVFREIPIDIKTINIGFAREETKTTTSLDTFLSDKVAPEDIRYILGRIKSPTIIIIDEIDRVRNRHTTSLLADTIKTLSDHSVNTTLVLVGVADSVDQLIAEHRSIERSLVQVRMPRMSHNELLELIDKGFSKAGMTIDGRIRQQIAFLSRGLPHFTHLLGLEAATNAAWNNRTNVVEADLMAAIHKAVEKAHQSILSAYHKATSSSRAENLYGSVLLACALAETDSLGYYAAADLREPMSTILGKQCEVGVFSRHLNDFCEPLRGPILERAGSKHRFRFRFINPMMQPFLLLKGLADKKITTASIRAVTAAHTSTGKSRRRSKL